MSWWPADGNTYFGPPRICEDAIRKRNEWRGWATSYQGPWDVFPLFASDLLRAFNGQMDERRHRDLYEEIAEGDHFQSFLDAGMGQKISRKFLILPAVIAFLSLLLLFRGIIYKKIQRKPKRSPSSAKQRLNAVPLLLSYIPVVAAIGLLSGLFSVYLWQAYSIDQFQVESLLTNMNDRSLKASSRANCYLQVNVAEGVVRLKKMLDAYNENASVNCTLQGGDSHMETLKNEQMNVGKANVAVAEFMAQLNELKNLNLMESQGEIDYISSKGKSLQDELTTVYEDFDGVSAYLRELNAKSLKQKQNLLKELNSVSDPIKKNLDDIAVRMNRVVESVDENIPKAVQWINAVGKRMLRMKKTLPEEADPLVYFILFTTAVVLPAILAIAALAIGFLALSIRIVYPKALLSFPKATKKVRRSLSSHFFAQCILIIGVVFCSIISLYIASSLNSSCHSIYDNDEIKIFSKDNQMKEFVFTRYDESTFNWTFGEMMDVAQYGSVFSSKLLLNSQKISLGEWMAVAKEKIKEHPIHNLVFESQRQIIRKLLLAIDSFVTIDSDVLNSKKSLLVSLVAAKMEFLKSELKSLSFYSLDERSIDGCSFSEDQFFFDSSLQSVFAQTVGNHRSYLWDTEFLRSLRDSYLESGQTVCIYWKTTSSGVWLAGTLLSMVLLVSAVILFKTSNQLDLEGIDEVELTDTASVSTIYAPLIDEHKNPTSLEI